MALAAVTALYVSFYPSMEGIDLQPYIENLPEGVVNALGYDQIAIPGGYLESTVYGLLGPVLLLVFAISHGARLLAGREEDGTLELELTAPVARSRVLLGRLLALWLDLVVLAAVVAGVTVLLTRALGVAVGLTGIVAGASGLLLLALAFGTLAMTVGAATGRRALALGVPAGLAVLGYILHAAGPTLGVTWMTAVSPWSWYLGESPLTQGFDPEGLALLAGVTLVAVVAGLPAFDRRDLMV